MKNIYIYLQLCVRNNQNSITNIVSFCIGNVVSRFQIWVMFCTQTSHPKLFLQVWKFIRVCRRPYAVIKFIPWVICIRKELSLACDDWLWKREGSIVGKVGRSDQYVRSAETVTGWHCIRCQVSWRPLLPLC